jgi:hypothetical protein
VCVCVCVSVCLCVLSVPVPVPVVQSVTADAPLTVDEDVLRALNPNEVFVRKWPGTSLPVEFYKSMIPDVGIALCQKCNRFFHEVRRCREPSVCTWCACVRVVCVAVATSVCVGVHRA